jgi:hypothetical protein
MDALGAFTHDESDRQGWGVGGAGAASGLHVLAPDDAERPSLQRFIAEVYFRTYGARLHHFARQLVGLRRAQGGWSAGVGYTLAGREPLFLEQYLNRPAESEIAARLGVSVRREQLVEVGNLAASSAGAARRLIVCMTGLLHGLNRTWVVFTSTRSLLNSFARLDIAPIVLAPADPMRLVDQGRDWGSYYDTHPQVMTANIPLGFGHLRSRLSPLPPR